MSFRDQVRWSRKWGAISLLLGVFLLGVMYLFQANGRNDVGLFLSYLGIALLMIGAILLVFGGLGRPWDRIMYQKLFLQSDGLRNRYIRNPIARLWVWVDKNGKDRDA